jgi:hypothetical protein
MQFGILARNQSTLRGDHRLQHLDVIGKISHIRHGQESTLLRTASESEKIALPRRQRPPGLLRDPPVDAFQKHGEERGAEMDFAVLGSRPDEPAALETL